MYRENLLQSRPGDFKGRNVLGGAFAAILLAVLLTACGDDSSGTAGDDGAGESLSLTVGAGHEAGGALTYTNLMQDFLVPEIERRVEDETSHSISINEAYGGSIAATDEVLDAIETGLLDIGGVCYCFEPSALFLHNVDLHIPFTSPDPHVAMEAFRRVFDEIPYMTEVIEESHNQRLLALYGTSDYGLVTVNPVDDFNSLDGLSITAAGANLPWIPSEGINVTGVQGGLPEWYTGLQTGVYEGAIIYPEGAAGYALHEVAPNYVEVGFGASPQGGIHINLDTWGELPEDVQEIIASVGEEYESRIPSEIAAEREEALEQMASENADVSQLDDSTRQEWADSLMEHPLAQIEEATSRGLDKAQDVFQTYIGHQEELGYEFPRAWTLE